MDTTTEQPEPAYHLLLDREEVPVAASALRLYISDEAHQPRIREIAREVLAALEHDPDANVMLSVPLSAPGMKIAYSAVRLLLNDLQREQADERATLWAILDKLPDEHAVRAISIE
jgi:hypothetical protein